MSYTVFPDGKYGEAAEAVYNEVMRAKAKHPQNFTSHHEGFAILLEEVDELWDDVKKDRKKEAIIEAIQVGAMVIRFVAEFGTFPYSVPKKAEQTKPAKRIFDLFEDDALVEIANGDEADQEEKQIIKEILYMRNPFKEYKYKNPQEFVI